jgi:hypothetical protein
MSCEAEAGAMVGPTAGSRLMDFDVNMMFFAIAASAFD